MSGRVARALLSGLTLFFSAGPCAAAEGGDPVTTPLGWFFRFLNFVILVGVPVYLLWRKAPAFFARRRHVILAAMSEAGRLKEEAEQRLRDAEEKLAGLAAEVEHLREAARREAEAEAARILQLARDEVQRIERAAYAESQAAERAARLELKGLAARLAVARAEAAIRQQADSQVQSQLFDAFVESLARSVH